MSSYRPTRSQQLAIASAVRDKYKIDQTRDIIVHHVLEDTPLKLVVQLEIRHIVLSERQLSCLSKETQLSLRDPFSKRNLPDFVRATL